MTKQKTHPPTSLSNPSTQKGVELLLQAARYVRDTATDPWVFAVERRVLEQAGLTSNDLRWLLVAGYALHADEVTHTADSQRRFGPTGLAKISSRSCFILTPKGEDKLAQALPSEIIQGSSGNSKSSTPGLTNSEIASQSLSNRTQSSQTPHWDRNRRELRLGNKIIKRFRVPAPNQELLLAAFQEQDWPEYIDDPLVPARDIDPKDRLKAAIRCLNRNQQVKLIRFRGNGNGLRIYWELIG